MLIVILAGFVLCMEITEDCNQNVQGTHYVVRRCIYLQDVFKGQGSKSNFLFSFQPHNSLHDWTHTETVNTQSQKIENMFYSSFVLIYSMCTV